MLNHKPQSLYEEKIQQPWKSQARIDPHRKRHTMFLDTKSQHSKDWHQYSLTKLLHTFNVCQDFFQNYAPQV